MRTRKAIKNLLFYTLQQLTLIISNFFMPPILVSNYGSAVNGLVQTIRQIINYVQLTGAGIANASVVAMYKPITQNDYKTLSGIYNATDALFLKAGNIFSIICFIVAVIYPLTLDGEVPYLTVALLVIVMGISGASEFYMCGKYQAIINAHQESYIVGIAQMVGNLTNMFFLFFLTFLNQSIVVVQLGMSSIYVLRILILHYYVKRKYTFLIKEEKPLFDRITQRRGAIVHQISTLVVLGSSTIIVSVLRGLREASIFTVYYMIFSGINMLCTIVSNTIYTSFGDVIARGEKKILKDAFNIYEFVFLIIITVVFVSTYVLIMPFVKIYTANMTDTNYYLPFLALMFIIVGIANNVRVPYLTLVNGAGHFLETKNRAIIEMVINVTGQIGFGYFFGMYGVLLGSICSFGYRTLDFIFYANHKIAEQSVKKSFFRIIINILVGIVIAVLLKHVMVFDPSGYIQWMLYAFVICIESAIIVLGINAWIDKKSFLECLSILKGLFKRKNA
ncbi:hypothetical protein QUW03_02335 [Faecalicoccus acidiformans]|uniref:lipopolysaccharide biosynthesis protein n=1 Tax=Faecalicoccus acidiformans TaxID=915173 RepID=UPI0025A3C0E0|nr:hypothetical protein [Faecalicoccus acidiformans]MDM8203206.1 hypothetical protein [Faecalicoccus acidiformans]